MPLRRGSAEGSVVSVTLKGVTKRFGDVTAVDHVSLRIERGELFFLLGPSGCGKTTLLRMLAGLTEADEGEIWFDDRLMNDVPAHRRNTGMVFQNYALWPHMTVWENVAYGLEVRRVGREKLRERVEEVLEIVRMAEYADRFPGQLSGGQQQRVALARALVVEPEVVLLDEPLSNLDAKLRLEMREEVRRIHERVGRTMIYVTHDQKEALSMADRLAVLDAGRIWQVGSPRQVYARPGNRKVAEFIGEANFITGKVVRFGEGVEVETGVGLLRSSAFPNGLSMGREVQVMVRPEALRIGGGGNRLEGTVERVMYLGDVEQYFVRLRDGVLWKAVEAHPKGRLADVGEQVVLSCDPEDLIVLTE